ncbi:hypothetical protein [Vogesella indigofera]|uniref:hypothetical protein n=1 Tax=Vogesella indigofera TaxID=45465 RepID=UPI00234E613E|nr:hypothetical protein [Vogesella indigofera]MDC7699586.1 hypothetical protein [Vogesella indigofera]
MTVPANLAAPLLAGAEVLVLFATTDLALSATALNTATLAALGGSWRTGAVIRVKVLPGVTLIAASAAAACFSFGAEFAGNTVIFDNQGTVYGRGGTGGQGGTGVYRGGGGGGGVPLGAGGAANTGSTVGKPGGTGGIAVQTAVPLQVSNAGVIAGGGGGGGGAGGGGNGSGTGTPTAGATATQSTAGGGGTTTGNSATYANAGGTGGALGVAGGTGKRPQDFGATSGDAAGAGGAAGAAIAVAGGAVTYLVRGTIYGAAP